MNARLIDRFPTSGQIFSPCTNFMAKKPKDRFSAETQTAPKTREKDFYRLGRMLKESNSLTWDIGDLLVRCIDVHDYRLCEITQKFSHGKSYLSKLYKAAKAFPFGVRNVNLPWYLHYICCASIETAARELTRFTGEEQTINYGTALAQMMAAKDDDGKPIRDARAATKHFIGEARKKLPKKNPILAQLQAPDLINNCHHCDNRELLKRFAPNSIKLVNLDPPYANYRKMENQKLHKGTSVALTDADNEDPAQAIQVTCDVIRALPPLLARNGVILLWQAATNYLRIPICQAIEDAGLECFVVVTWNKSRPQPGAFASAFTLCSELLYVISRKDEVALNHDDNLSRDNVLEFAPIHQKAVSIEQHHIYEKPEEMMEFLVRKHSSEGDLVADLFGCSGSCCIAAHRRGRNWVYCESNVNNFAWGSRRVLEATSDDSKVAV